MEYLAKKVVEFETGKVVGYVIDVALDYKKLKQYGYIVADEETEGEYLLRFEDVESEGDVVLVSDISKLEFAPTREKNMLGKEVLSEVGVSLGLIRRLVFDKRMLVTICTDKVEMPAKLISFVGQDCVFVKGRSKKRRSKPRFVSGAGEAKVEIMGVRKEQIVPQKINLSFSSFAGKLATADVFGYNNERIVSKNEKITKIIFENAKKHNKLNELFFAIKNGENKLNKNI